MVTPEDTKSPLVGFENHWNVFHSGKKGLDRTVANGLVCFLNSTALDDHFRVFSGHTQVNATDLRNMTYPSVEGLKTLGGEFLASMNQQEIDDLLALL